MRPFWKFECGAEAGRKALAEAEETLGKERKKLDSATHLCTLFEFPDLIKESQRMIADMESNCKLMYKVLFVVRPYTRPAPTSRCLAKYSCAQIFCHATYSGT